MTEPCRLQEVVNAMPVRKRYIFFPLVLFCALCKVTAFPSHSSAAETITLQGEPAGKTITLEWVVEPKYLWARDFFSGVAWFQEGNNDPWKLIDKSGKILVDAFQAEIVSWCGLNTKSKLAGFRNSKKLWGYVDVSGKTVIPPQYEMAGLFVDGVAKVGKKIDGEFCYGVIDSNGKTILPIRYKRVEHLRHDRFGVGKIGELQYVDEKGNALTDLIFERLEESSLSPVVCTATLKNKKVGLLDERGKWVLPPVYDWISGGREAPIAVKKDGRVGFVDIKGKTVIGFRFQKASGYGFSEGLAVVSFWENGKSVWGVIDKKGTLLFKLGDVKMEESRYRHGFLLVRNTSKRVGLIDREGNQYWLPGYLELNSFTGYSEGILLVLNKKTQRYGCLKITGNKGW